MTDDHFGLTGRPFALTPDPDFWFESATHRRAMSYLSYGLAQGEGVVVITGEVGSGKTTLASRLLRNLDSDAVRAITLPTTQADGEGTLRLVAAALGIDVTDQDPWSLAIEEALLREVREGRRVLLLVDEAQNLSDGAVEALRLLSNLQLGAEALLQIVLLGQPELRRRLARDPVVEPLRQRVVASHHLEAMTSEEVGPYLIHRLRAVGWNGRPDFTDDAVDAIAGWSDGLPRRINTLATRVMLAAVTSSAEVIDGGLVRRIAGDLEGDMHPVTVGAPDLEPESENGRLRALEARVEAQDRALRHTLRLLADWMEREPVQQEPQRFRGAA